MMGADPPPAPQDVFPEVLRVGTLSMTHLPTDERQLLHEWNESPSESTWVFIRALLDPDEDEKDQALNGCPTLTFLVRKAIAAGLHGLVFEPLRPELESPFLPTYP